MDFKEHFKFSDSILPIAVLGILFVGDVSALICIIIMREDVKFSGTTAGIIVCTICAVILLALILMVFSVITIDEKKIELRTLRGIKLSFCLDDIYKIEKKVGPKGVFVFVIYGNTPQVHFGKIKAITLIATERREKILKHFITNPNAWNNNS